MSGPWEDYQQPQANPWDEYAVAPVPAQGNALSGAARALEANLPFVDRAVAAAKTYLPTSLGGVSPTFSSLITGQGTDYASNLAAEKAKNAQFAEQNPWTNAVGGLAAYAPAALIPTGSASILGRALAGGAVGGGLGTVQGASNSPDLTNLPETGKDVALGAGGGATLGVAAPSAARLIGGVFARGAIDPAHQALVQALQNAGVKPTAGQITGNQGLQKLEASISDIPFGGGGAEPIRQANNAAFTKAILTKAGFPDVPNASPESLNAAHEALGKQFDQLGGRNAIIPDDQFASDLHNAVNDYHNMTGTPAPGISKVVEGITGIASHAEAPAARARESSYVPSSSNTGRLTPEEEASFQRYTSTPYGTEPSGNVTGFPFAQNISEPRKTLNGARLTVDEAPAYISGENILNARKVGSDEIDPFSDTPRMTRTYNIDDEAGRDHGVINLNYDHEQKNIHVTSMDVRNLAGGLSRENAQRLLDQVQRDYPEAKTISGMRITGARAADRPDVKIPLRPIAIAPPGTPEIAGVISARERPKVPTAPRVILGEEYNNLRSQLGKTAQKLRFTDPAQAEAYRGVQDALDSAMERSIAAANPADLGAFQAVRQKYKNLLPIEYAAGSAGADAANGMVSPQKMRTALATGGNRRSYARGIGDLAPLTNAGNAILTNFPQSGTAPRTMMAHALQTAGGLAGGLGGASGGVEGAGLGATAGALVLPALAGRAIMSRPGQAILANALAKRFPASQAAPRALSRASMAAALAANADLQAQRNQAIAP